MISIGDKIVCIDNLNNHPGLFLNKIYTISIIGKQNYFGIKEFDDRCFSCDLFMLLDVYERKNKIIKIKERINKDDDRKYIK